MQETSSPTVVVLIVCFNGREHLSECLASVRASDDGHVTRRVVVVDNASTDGSIDFIRQHHPDVEIVSSSTNLGFAGGNNLGWETIRRRYPDAEYLALLNQDTRVASGWLPPLVAFMDAHPQCGAAQAKLLLHGEPDRVNTLGNCSHFLGFGYMTGYRQVDNTSYATPPCITFASGAAVMLRTAVLRRVGLFQSEYFAYLEDAEVGWKLRQVGFTSHMVPQSIVYHKHRLVAPFRNYYLLERNRLLLIFTYYRLRTLLVLLPAFLLMEAGQWIFCVRNNLVNQRVQVVRYFMNFSHLCDLRRTRIEAQARRTVTDREFMQDFTGAIECEALDNPLLRWVANPVLGAYWFVAKRLICW